METKDLIEEVGKIMASESDPDGWYTGVTITQEYDVPVQDNDDL